MIPLFDWEEEYRAGLLVYYRKSTDGNAVAIIETEFELYEGGFHHDVKIFTATIIYYPNIERAKRKRLSQIKQWANKELHKLGYRLVDNKYKVML